MRVTARLTEPNRDARLDWHACVACPPLRDCAVLCICTAIVCAPILLGCRLQWEGEQLCFAVQQEHNQLATHTNAAVHRHA